MSPLTALLRPPNRLEYRYTSRDEATLEDFSGSLNQAAPPDKVPVTDFLRFLNARVCEDGKTIERRPGMTRITTFTGKRVLGAYGINEVDETKLLACLNDDIQLLSGGSWGSIFTPSRQALSPVQIAQHKGLTFIAGYEKPIMVRAGVAAYPGLDPPTVAPVGTPGSSGSDVLGDSYPETNVDHLGQLRQATARTAIAQSFKSTKDLEVNKITLKLRKVGSPTGNLWAEIHSSQAGTSATKNASTYINGQASADVALAGITAAYASVDFVFAGTKPVLTTGTTYFIVVYCSATVSTSDFVEVGFDSGEPDYLDGKYYEINGSLGWSGNENVDLVFEVWGATGTTENLLEFGAEITGYDYNLRDTVAHAMLSQSFQLSETSVLDGINLPLKKILDELGIGPTGKLWVEIHSSQAGTSLTKNASANIVGTASAEIDIETTIGSAEFQNYYFAFTGTKPALTGTTTYYIVLYKSVTYSATRYIEWSQSAGYADGSGYQISSTVSWSAVTGGLDFCFEIEGYKASAQKIAEYPLANLDEYGELYEEGSPLTSVTGVAASDIFTKVGHGLASGNLILLRSLAGGTGLTVEFQYYVIAAAADTFQLSLTPGGSAVDFTTNVSSVSVIKLTAAHTLMAQSFTPIFDGDISKVKLYLSKVGSPSGHIWVEIHSSTDGTAGTKAGSTNIVGTESDEITAASLDAFPTFGLQTFTFSGTKPTVVRDATYYIVVYAETPTSATDFVRIGIDRDSPEADGSAYQINASFVWGELPGADLIYYLYRVSGDIAGTYQYAVTFVRGGNYPCESNGSPASADVVVGGSQSVVLSHIQVSTDPTVTARNIYRTEAGMTVLKWMAQIPDNSTTTYTSNEDDSSLGDDLSYGSSRPPDGTTIETWDGKLWVAGVPNYEELLFPSGLDTPEQFLLTYYLALREREGGKIKLIMEFADELWAFKATSIWKVTRSGSDYVVDKMVDDIGIGAVGSAVRCGKDMLIFLSNHKRIEILTSAGLAKPEIPVSAKVRATLASINDAAINKCAAGNYVERGEYRLAVPTGTNTEPDTVIVFNYLRGTFALDAYNHYPTSIMTTDYSLGLRGTLFGSSAGSLYRVDEEVATDDGAAINWDVQTGWLIFPSRVKISRCFLDYALPSSKAIAMRVYKSWEATPAYSKTLTGNTPSGSNPELRDTISARLGMSVQGRQFSFRFINFDDAVKVKISRINLQLIVREKGAGALGA